MDRTRVSEAVGVLAAADIAAASPDECAELLKHARRARGWVDAIEARVTTRLRELHDNAGAAPASDQHTRCGGVSSAEGKRKERRSETIDAAPSFGDALADGTIGAEHVDALANATTKLDDNVRDQLLALEDDLLADARAMSPETFGRSCRELARRLERDAGLERNRRQRRDTFISRRLNPATGMVEGRYAFHPELANQIFGAVDKEVAAMIADGERRGDREFVERRIDRNHLAAEALGRLIAGGHQASRPLEADITVLIDERTLATGEIHEHGVCETSEGFELPPASLRRLVCQGRILPIIVDGAGNVLDAGRSIRNANRRQRRALRAMYRTCAFVDCDVSFDRCEIHHIVPWEIGGLTDLKNLVPICSRHHHHVHEFGWALDLAPDRTLTIRGPDGEVFAISEPDVPPQRRDRRRRPAA